MRRVIVCGSRRWRDRKRIADRMYDLSLESENLGCTVVHGWADGADKIADQEAKKIGLITEGHRPDYDYYPSKVAPLKRNERMAELGADLCIAFWDGRSTGTQHMIEQAKKHGIPIEIVMPT